MSEKSNTEEYMAGYAKGFENGYVIGKSVCSGYTLPVIKLCPVCGLIEGEPCTTPSCYYGANKNR